MNNFGLIKTNLIEKKISKFQNFNIKYEFSLEKNENKK